MATRYYLSAEIIAQIVEQMNRGLTRGYAAKIVGIPPNVLALWYERGRQELSRRYLERERSSVKNLEVTLYQEISKIEGEQLHDKLKKLDKKGKDDWRETAWRLEREYRDEYGKVTSKDATAAIVDAIRQRVQSGEITAADAARLLEILAVVGESQ